MRPPTPPTRGTRFRPRRRPSPGWSPLLHHPDVAADGLALAATLLAHARRAGARLDTASPTVGDLDERLAGRFAELPHLLGRAGAARVGAFVASDLVEPPDLDDATVPGLARCLSRPAAHEHRPVGPAVYGGRLHFAAWPGVALDPESPKGGWAVVSGDELQVGSLIGARPNGSHGCSVPFPAWDTGWPLSASVSLASGGPEGCVAWLTGLTADLAELVAAWILRLGHEPATERVTRSCLPEVLPMVTGAIAGWLGEAGAGEVQTESFRCAYAGPADALPRWGGPVPGTRWVGRWEVERWLARREWRR